MRLGYVIVTPGACARIVTNQRTAQCDAVHDCSNWRPRRAGSAIAPAPSVGERTTIAAARNSRRNLISRRAGGSLVTGAVQVVANHRGTGSGTTLAAQRWHMKQEEEARLIASRPASRTAVLCLTRRWGVYRRGIGAPVSTEATR